MTDTADVGGKRPRSGATTTALHGMQIDASIPRRPLAVRPLSVREKTWRGVPRPLSEWCPDPSLWRELCDDEHLVGMPPSLQHRAFVANDGAARVLIVRPFVVPCAVPDASPTLSFVACRHNRVRPCAHVPLRVSLRSLNGAAAPAAVRLGAVAELENAPLRAISVAGLSLRYSNGEVLEPGHDYLLSPRRHVLLSANGVMPPPLDVTADYVGHFVAPTVPGHYELHVELEGIGTPLSGSPLRLEVDVNAADNGNNVDDNSDSLFEAVRLAAESAHRVDHQHARVHYCRADPPAAAGGDPDFVGIELGPTGPVIDVARWAREQFHENSESLFTALQIEQNARLLYWMTRGDCGGLVDCVAQHRRSGAAVFVYSSARVRQRRAMKIVANADGEREIEALSARFRIDSRDTVTLHHVAKEPPDVAPPSFVGLELEFVSSTFADLLARGGQLACMRSLDVGKHDLHVLHILLNVLRIVESAHQRGLVLCDLKEANVAVFTDTMPWTVKLLDLESVRDLEPRGDPAAGAENESLMRVLPSLRPRSLSSSSSPSLAIGEAPLRFTPGYRPTVLGATEVSYVVDTFAVVHMLQRSLADESSPLYALVRVWDDCGHVQLPNTRTYGTGVARAQAMLEARADAAFADSWVAFVSRFGGRDGARALRVVLERYAAEQRRPSWLQIPPSLARATEGFAPCDVRYFVACHSAGRYASEFGVVGGEQWTNHGYVANDMLVIERAIGDPAARERLSLTATPHSFSDRRDIEFVRESLEHVAATSDHALLGTATQLDEWRRLVEQQFVASAYPKHEAEIVAIKHVRQDREGSDNERPGVRIFCVATRFSDFMVRLLAFKSQRPVVDLSDRITLPHFAGALGVHVTVITCDNRMLFVRRNPRMALSPGQWICCMAETVRVDDASPYAAVARGLREELNVILEPWHQVRLTGLGAEADNYLFGFVGFVRLHDPVECVKRGLCRVHSHDWIADTLRKSALDATEACEVVGVPNEAVRILDFLRENVVERGGIACAQLALQAMHGVTKFNRALAEVRFAPQGVSNVLYATNSSAQQDSGSPSSSTPPASALAPISIADALRDARASIDRLVSVGGQIAVSSATGAAEFRAAISALGAQIQKIKV
jgi:hypothetical protein